MQTNSQSLESEKSLPSMTLKRSRWVHEYHDQENDRYFLFHAVSMEVFEVDAEAFAFLRGAVAPFALNFDDTGTSRSLINGIKSLMGVGLIVDTRDDEVGTFESQIQKSHAQAKLQSQQRKIATARILLTEECNMRCKYCFIDHTASDSDFHTVRSVIDKVLENASEEGLRFQFFGGEPLLKFSLMRKAVEYVKSLEHAPANVSYTITTNGTLINAQIAKFLAENRFEICISLDGKREITDANRVYRNGKGTYDQALEGYHKLKEAGCYVGFLLTPILQNQGEIAAFLQDAISDYKPDFFAINTPQPTETGWNVDGREYAQDLINCYKVAIDNKVPFSSTFNKVTTGLLTRERCVSSCFNPRGDRVASFTIKGEVSPCIVGWQKEFLKPLEKLNDADTFMTQADLRQPKNCYECPALNICGGPCHLEDYFFRQTGNWDHNRCDFFETALSWAVQNIDLVRANP